MLGLEDFMANGIASANVAHRLGTSMSASEELARAVGPQGAIGIVPGSAARCKVAPETRTG
jgi:hypothetical protein